MLNIRPPKKRALSLEVGGAGHIVPVSIGKAPFDVTARRSIIKGICSEPWNVLLRCFSVRLREGSEDFAVLVVITLNPKPLMYGNS